MEIKISAVIPVYNSEEYLAECIESVLSQTLREIEVICVDDCSEDASLRILREYADKDSRVVVLANSENQRAGACRNRGLHEAKGEYIHFLDADDYLLPDAYEAMYAAAAKSGLDMLKARVHSIDANTREEALYPRYDLLNFKKSEFGAITSYTKCPKKLSRLPVTPWNAIYKRTFLLENGIGFNRLLTANDRSFSVEALIKAGSLMVLNHFILCYRVNVNGSLVGLREKHFGCLFESYDIVERLCAGLPEAQRFYILESAMNDTFFWYRKYRSSPQIIEQMKAFLGRLDISVFSGRWQDCRWHYDYLQLTGKKITPAFKLCRKAKGYNNLAGRVWQYCYHYGLRKTLHFIKRNIGKKEAGTQAWKLR
jgi:glycosyltransferase involved in cell wall biosynthesis